MATSERSLNPKFTSNQSLNGQNEFTNIDISSNNQFNSQLEIFGDGLDSLCIDLKNYLDSLTTPNSIYNLHPSFNKNLNTLFTDSDISTLSSNTNGSNNHNKSDSSNNNSSLSQHGSKFADTSASKHDSKNNNHELQHDPNLSNDNNINDHTLFFNNLSSLCSNKMFQLENDVIDTLLKHETELSDFSLDLNHSNSTLEVIENSLTHQFKLLEVSCNNIKKLHDESKDLSFGLENRKKLVERLQEFVNDVIISPSMIKSLCGDPINEDYVMLVEDFSKKVNSINNKYKDKEYPAVEFTKIQIKKLELVLIRRIFDFLSMEISNLSVPKVNIQLLQMTRFNTYHPLYKYMMNFTEYTTDLKKLYVYTMKKTYSHLFENYLNALESCFEKERCRDVSYILRVRTPEVVKRLNKTFSYYDLNGRDAILDDFNSQPTLPTGLKPASLKKELIVKSYFKLLVDTCATELNFLGSFFGCANTFVSTARTTSNGSNSENNEQNESDSSNTDDENDSSTVHESDDKVDVDANGSNTQSSNNTTNFNTVSTPLNKPERAMLKEIFSEVFEIISFNLKTYFRASFDLVALGLIYSVIRFNRKFLLFKHISFFESEMYELETMVHDRFNFVIKEAHNLILKTTKNPAITMIFSWNPAPFILNSSHILTIIFRINEYTNRLNGHVIQLLETIIDVMDRCSSRLDPNKNAVFLINNLAPFVEVLEKLPDKSEYKTQTFDMESCYDRMKRDLDSSLTFYSNYLLTEFISDLLNIMNRKEEEEDIDVAPKKTLTLATEALEYRTICIEFIENYNERIHLIKNLISQAFVYTPTLALVNTHVFDSFYETYNKFYNVVIEMFKESPSEWLSKMPNPSEFNM